MKDDIKTIMAAVFSIDKELIDDRIAYGTNDKWDSIRHLNLMVELESHYDVIFEPEDIQIMTNLDSIIDCINQKKKS
jgi:acyl carrier protein